MAGAPFWSKYGVPLAFVIVAIVFASLNARFATSNNALLVLQQASVDAIAALGLTMILVGGGIDLSQGSVMALSSAVAGGLVARHGVPEITSIGFGLAAGALVGGVNGFFAEHGKVPAFIVTLATLFVVRGLVNVYLGGEDIVVPRDRIPILHEIAVGKFAGIPIMVWLCLVLYTVGAFFMRYSRWGLRTYAVGSSEESSSRAGIRVSRHRMGLYVIAGLLSAVSGLMLLGRLSDAPADLATGEEFYVITAAVLGGASLFGGKGHVWRSFMGAVFLAMIANGLVLAGVPAFYQQVAVGLLLLFALLLDRFGRDDGRS
jgi:ribose transport system permease protein